MLIRVIDFETTGFPPEGELARAAAKRLGTYPAIVEIGWCDLIDQETVGHPTSTLVNPGRSIPSEASAIHHIIDSDVATSPPREQVRPQLMEAAEAFAAHNASFEQAFFTGGTLPWICTLKAARRIWPDAPSHSNQALRYWLGLEADRETASPAHRAGPDAYVTALLLRSLFHAGATFEQMVEWTKVPSLLPRLAFGKHRGTSWTEVPIDYLEWLAFKSDMGEDEKFTARHYLDMRALEATNG